MTKEPEKPVDFSQIAPGIYWAWRPMADRKNYWLPVIIEIQGEAPFLEVETIIGISKKAFDRRIQVDARQLLDGTVKLGPRIDDPATLAAIVPSDPPQFAPLLSRAKC